MPRIDHTAICVRDLEAARGFWQTYFGATADAGYHNPRTGLRTHFLTFQDGTSWSSLGLKGDEKVTIRGLQGDLKPRQTLTAEIVSADGGKRDVPLLCRIDTLDELDYYRNGGILHYVLRKLAA